MKDVKTAKMIESDAFSYEMWKLAKGWLKYLVLTWLLVMPIFELTSGKFSWGFLGIYLFILSFYLLFRRYSKRIRSKLCLAKMDEERIILKREGEAPLELSWNEIYSLSRLRLTSPALYILTLRNTPKQEYIFPASSPLFTLSIGFRGLGFIRDFSKMGKFIRKMKKNKNLKSYYRLRFDYFMRKMR